jgi:putative ATP-dependent endonuclease of OLD family
MNCIGPKTDCRAIPKNQLIPEEARKFNHHVRRNRGELLFARTWILVEGETDVSVFAECADLLEVDFHRLGIRIVECSQAGGPGIFIKVADALGISWHLVADSDPGGQHYVDDARSLLAGRREAEHISSLTYPNIDILLCCNGYGQPYLDGVGPQKVGELASLTVGSPPYWEKVYKIIKVARGFSKPAAALKSILMMRSGGKHGVPTEVKDILNRIIALRGRG